MEPATAAFNDSTLPRCGSLTRKSQLSPHQAAQPAAFMSDDDAQRPVQIDLAQGLGIFGQIHPGNPDILFLQLSDGLYQIGDLSDEQMFGCAGGILHDGRRDVGGAAVLQNDAMHAADFGRTQQAADVLRPV